MPKINSAKLLCAILISIAFLFTAANVGAQEEETCPPTISQAGPFTISLMGDGPVAAEEGGFVWTYEINAYPDYYLKKVLKVLLTYPDCCGEDITILEPTDAEITPPCESALPLRQWPKVCDDFTLSASFSSEDNKNLFIVKTKKADVGINTIGILTYFKFYVAAVPGPACSPISAPANEPIVGKIFFKGEEFDWNLLLDVGGNSYDVECAPDTPCTITTLKATDIEFGDGFIESLPFDEPFVATNSPGCTYVRTRSGAVKKICP